MFPPSEGWRTGHRALAVRVFERVATVSACGGFELDYRALNALLERGFGVEDKVEQTASGGGNDNVNTNNKNFFGTNKNNRTKRSITEVEVDGGGGDATFESRDSNATESGSFDRKAPIKKGERVRLYGIRSADYVKYNGTAGSVVKYKDDELDDSEKVK